MDTTNNPLPLPPVYNTVFQQEQLAQLFDDIAACTRVLENQLKQVHQALSNTAPVTLEEAFQQIAQGRLRGVQIRYHYDGQDWCDTIMRSREGYRVVRIAQGEQA